MPTYGAALLSLSLGLCFLTVVLMGLFVRKGDERYFFVGQRTCLTVCFLVVLATITLLAGLMKSDFNVDYVAKYTSIGTPTIYKFTALWAGQSGSLLFWLFVLSCYVAVVIVQNRNRHEKLMPYVIMTLSVIQGFFLLMVNFVANPFAPVETDFILQDGLGLNPLLQNPTMAIHPPMLYLGYVGFSVPFAFAIAALCSRQLDAVWVRSIRRWTLFTWLALGIGILLGGWWAYNELGWGGYWAWDPVENASFMPWLTGTAFIHSIIIQEKKNMLRVWNMILILVTFLLCIFGTFLTRSGIVSSVHSFTQSSLGPMFFGFVLLILAVSIYLVLSRLDDLKSGKRMESFVSRESGFLFNNVVFVSICFAVLWGTMFPIISEAVTGTQITVGAPFFNQITIPIGLLLLTLSGIGPLLAWRRTSRESLTRNFSIPVLIGLVMAGVVMIAGVRSIYPVMTVALTAFVTSTISTEFWRGITVRRRKFNESSLQALFRMISKNRSRYGGYIVHIGIVFMFVGFIGKAFDKDREWAMSVGDEVRIAGYDIRLTALDEEERSNHYAWIATLDVTKKGETVTSLQPEKRIYFHKNPNPDRRQPHSELSLHSTWREDVYSVFGGIDPEKELLTIKIMVNRLVRFVWLGGYVLLFGTVIALWPDRRGL
ncbi:MAG: heme lyase CcmF/NrfE family subunit [Candidatus Neomarinimicrobiota bacterium]|nr:heme lyase CcmF/NrfE family subunit [Candidatus Neomarinimicrobiota bacterium]